MVPESHFARREQTQVHESSNLRLNIGKAAEVNSRKNVKKIIHIFEVMDSFKMNKILQKKSLFDLYSISMLDVNEIDSSYK